MLQRIRSQRRVKGGRKSIWGALDPSVKKAVDLDARRFNVSKSFIVNTALGIAMGIKTEHYYEQEELTPAKVLRMVARR